MNKTGTRAYRFETFHHDRDCVLSLLPLERMLTEARKDLPPRVDCSRPQDAREELPLQLIARIKGQFKRSTPAHWISSSVCFGLKEMAGADV